MTDSSSNGLKLASLSIGSLSLTPEFDPDVLSYVVTTTNATNTVTAQAEDANASISYSLNGTRVADGTDGKVSRSATWRDGGNIVAVTVNPDELGGVSTTYTVTVTKA